MAETVQIQLGWKWMVRVTDYRIRLGIFEQPGSFSCTIGKDVPFRLLAETFPPRTPYQIYMDDVLIQTGMTDGFSQSGEGTEIRLSGRGLIGILTQSTVEAEHTFNGPSYLQLVKDVLELGRYNTLASRFGLENTIVSNNDANRKALTGTNKKLDIPPTFEVLTDDPIALNLGFEPLTVERTPGSSVSRVTYEVKRSEVGTSWWRFLVEHLRRAGLFIWEGYDGAIIVSSPDIRQSPLAKLVRTHQFNNIEDSSFSHNTANRHTECRVYGRGKKGKLGTEQFDGRFIDEEMVALMNPPDGRGDGGEVKLIKCMYDKVVESRQQADALARRTIAEERRNAWKLTYTIAGHYMLPSTDQPQSEASRVRPAPDIVVDVNDDYLGVYGAMMIEGVEFIGANKSTSTQLTMLRLEDCFFETPDPPVKLKKKGVNSDSVVILGLMSNTTISVSPDRLVPDPLFHDWVYPDAGDVNSLARTLERVEQDALRTPEQLERDSALDRTNSYWLDGRRRPFGGSSGGGNS